MGGATASPHSLQLVSPHISVAIKSLLNLSVESPISQPRPNVKWSKILINGIPTGTFKNSPAFPPECLHMVLSAINPSYASLTVTQKPSWVRPPSSYTPGSISSLSVAFEDPDGSKLKVLLAECYLYIFGNRASVKKWKQCHNNNKDKSKPHSAEHVQARDPPSIEDTVASPSHSALSQSASAPPPQDQQSTRKSNRTAKPTCPFEA